jgi:energy-coupling factor transporter ATP-binding protein EcfA2
VSNLTVRFGSHPALDHIEFEASGGEVVAIVGRNGTGKTTLLRALAGLQPFDGRIEIDGGRPDLGMVFQNPDLQLFNPTVRDEILFGISDPDRSLYQTVLQTVGLRPYEETPPLLLSEGEKKRLALATVLMRSPRDGVLLDEPSLGQDAAHKERLMAVAHALAVSGRLCRAWACSKHRRLYRFRGPGGLLGALTLQALRRAGFFAYLAEKR